jgi:hypothetical protein
VIDSGGVKSFRAITQHSLNYIEGRKLGAA